jgi:hypothetical protein
MLTAGTDSLTAVYSGDPIYDPGIGETSPAVTQTVNALPATLTLTSSTGTAASNVNDTVTFTAQLGGATFTPVNPSGTVAFTAAGNTIAGCGPVGPTLVAGNWQATCTTSALVAPSDSITATYSGDLNFTVSTPAALTQTVTALPATLTLTSSTGTSASNVNASVTFTAQLGGATFTPVNPSGTVAFTAAGNTIAGCGSVGPTLVAGNWQATCTTSALVAPSDSITATYSGDPSFTVASAATLTQTVTALPATLTLTSSTGTSASNVNASVTFTAQLGGATFTPVTPSGNVAFTAAGTTITNCGSQSVALVGGNWQATCTTSALVAPSDAIKATYSGDPSFAVSTAATLTQTVTPLPRHANANVEHRHNGLECQRLSDVYGTTGRRNIHPGCSFRDRRIHGGWKHACQLRIPVGGSGRWKLAGDLHDFRAGCSFGRNQSDLLGRPEFHCVDGSHADPDRQPAPSYARYHCVSIYLSGCRPASDLYGYGRRKFPDPDGTFGDCNLHDQREPQWRMPPL